MEKKNEITKLQVLVLELQNCKYGMVLAFLDRSAINVSWPFSTNVNDSVVEQ